MKGSLNKIITIAVCFHPFFHLSDSIVMLTTRSLNPIEKNFT